MSGKRPETAHFRSDDVSIAGRLAVIVAHPAHVLRIHRFCEIHRPLVYMLTDGSGSRGESRLPDAIRLVESLGATFSPLSCRLTDAGMYELIRSRDTDRLERIVRELTADLAANDVSLIAGDAVEGFNPVHDVCRYVVNTLAARLSARNYDFLLDGPPDAGSDSPDSIRIDLDDDAFERKMLSVREYPGIEVDRARAMSLYGESSFRTEFLRRVDDPLNFVGWSGPSPYYESYGAEMVAKGVYSELITFEEHMLPLARFLAGAADAAARV